MSRFTITIIRKNGEKEKVDCDNWEWDHEVVQGLILDTGNNVIVFNSYDIEDVEIRDNEL